MMNPLTDHLVQEQTKLIARDTFYYLFFPWFWFVVLCPGFILSIPSVKDCDDGISKTFAPGRVTILATLVHVCVWAFVVAVFYWFGAFKGINFPFTSLAFTPTFSSSMFAYTGKEGVLLSWLIYALLPIIAFVLLVPGLILSIPKTRNCDNAQSSYVFTSRSTLTTVFVHSFVFLLALVGIFSLGAALHLSHPVTDIGIMMHVSTFSKRF